MKKVTLLILAISVLLANSTFAVVDRGILVTGGGSICQEGETHFLIPDSCFTPSYGYLIIDSYVDPSYLNQYVEVEGELYYGVLCIMINVQTISLLGNPNQDTDEDGLNDACDNCPNTPNHDQLDTSPPQGNDIGDACDCESDFDCNGAVDANDVTAFLGDFGRSTFNNPCSNADPCNGDVDCNVNVDANDVTMFLEDFGRSQFFNPCPACEVGDWCLYEGDPFIKEYSDSGCLGMTQGAYSSSAFDECNIEDWALAEVIDDSIFITAYATYNCCSSIEVELSNDGNNLDVLVQEIVGIACFCNCCFQVDAEIAGLTPNEYNLTICSQNYYGPPICETEVVEVP